MFVDILSLIARLGARSRWHDERWAKWRRPRRGVSALERCQSPGFDLALLVVDELPLPKSFTGAILASKPRRI
jgi:hypothetical protein